MRLILAAGLALALSSYAHAADCTTLEQAQEAVVASGGRIAGAADYAGAVTDTTIIVETGQAILLLGFKAGCLVGGIVIEPQLEAKPPA